jgi:hypothetical protein
VDQAVEDGVGKGGIPDHVVPMLKGELAGDEGGLAACAVFDDFQEIAAFIMAEGSEPTVVQDHELGLLEAVHELGTGPIGPGQGQLLDESGKAEGATEWALATGRLGQGRGQVGLAGTGCPGDKNHLVVADPVAGGQAKDNGAVEPPGGAEVQILDGSLKAQPGLTQELGLAPVLAQGGFSVHQEAHLRHPLLRVGTPIGAGHAPPGVHQHGGTSHSNDLVGSGIPLLSSSSGTFVGVGGGDPDSYAGVVIMSPARISKFPPLGGVALDLHAVDPPSVPPPPPAPPNPAKIPVHGWVVAIRNPAAGLALTGKWSLASVMTEWLGDILHTHDWGPGQPHIPLPPILVSPSIAILVIKSSTKYWLPAFSVQQKQDGTFPGGAKPIAVSTPAFFVCTQNCQVYFPNPGAVCFQLVSSRWCAFTLADLAAGAIGVVSDAITGAISNKVGDMIPMTDAVGKEIANAALGHAINAAVWALDRWGPEGAPGGFGKFVRAMAGAAALGAGNTQVAGQLLTPIVGDVIEAGSNAVGEAGKVDPPPGAHTL